MNISGKSKKSRANMEGTLHERRIFLHEQQKKLHEGTSNHQILINNNRFYALVPMRN